MSVRNTSFTDDSSLSHTFKQTLEARYGPGINEKFRSYEKIMIKLTKEGPHITFLIKSRDSNVIPIGFRLKSPIPEERARKIVDKASRALLRNQISFHRWRKPLILDDATQRFEEIKELTDSTDNEKIFNKLDRTCDNIRRRLQEKHDRKFTTLINNIRPEPEPSNKTIINLSLSSSKKKLLSKGLNFAIAPKKTPILEMVSSLESVRLRQPDADEFRWKTRNIIEKAKPSSNLTKEEIASLKSLQQDSSIGSGVLWQLDGMFLPKRPSFKVIAEEVT